MPLPKGKPNIGKFKVAGGKYSVKELEQKYSKEGMGPVIYLKAGQSVRLRFFVKPEQWRLYTEHNWESGGKWHRVPCTGDGCYACDAEHEGREMTLVPAYDVEKKKVRFIKAGSRLAGDLIRLYQRTNKAGKSRLFDRDYNLLREGDGLDTKYILDDEEPEKRPEVKDLEVPDMDEMLESWVKAEYGGGKPSKKSSKKDDDFEEDDEEDESDEEDDEEDDDEDDEDEETSADEEEDDEEEGEEDEEDDDDDVDDLPKGKKRKAAPEKLKSKKKKKR